MTTEREEFIKFKNTIAGKPIPTHGFEQLQDVCMFEAWQARGRLDAERIAELEADAKRLEWLQLYIDSGFTRENIDKAMTEMEKHTLEFNNSDYDMGN